MQKFRCLLLCTGIILSMQSLAQQSESVRKPDNRQDSMLPDADSALQLVIQAGTIFSGDEEYQRYLKLSPFRMKCYEDSLFAKQVNAAVWFCKNYAYDKRFVEAVNFYLGSNQLFLHRESNLGSDTVQMRKGLDWKAFMRALIIDTVARNNWLRTGDSLVMICLKNSTSVEEKEEIIFSLFIRDFRAARNQFGLLPQNTGEESYWSLMEKQYWQLFYQKFQEHAQQFAALPVVADRAKDFLSQLKSFSPAVAEHYWRTLLHGLVVNPPTAKQKGLIALKGVAREQLDALDTERGLSVLRMSFTTMDNLPFDIEKLKGKVVIIDFWASWCKPCVDELPFLRSLYDKYRNHGLEIAGICLDESAALPRVKAIVQKYRVNWPQRFEGKGFGDSFSLLYGISSLPTVWVVDGSGKIISRNLRREKLEMLIAELLIQK